MLSLEHMQVKIISVVPMATISFGGQSVTPGTSSQLYSEPKVLLGGWQQPSR